MYSGDSGIFSLKKRLKSLTGRFPAIGVQVGPEIADRFDFRVVFVANFSHDLLEQIFQSDNAFDSAKFIDDDGHVKVHRSGAGAARYQDGRYRGRNGPAAEAPGY